VRASTSDTIDGFTEPYQTIDVAAAESGILTDIKVREGDAVRQGQVLATLDHDVLVALLAIAEQSMRSTGTLDSAQAELQLRQSRLEKLELLRAQGHASQEEIERARTDVTIAAAQVRTAQEEQLIRKLEYEKIKLQVEHRLLRAPIDGVISRIAKDKGEYVAPNDPRVMTLVQLDPLTATFSLSVPQAAQLALGQKVTLRPLDALDQVSAAAAAVEGSVEFIAPVTDAESGTVRVKVRIENPDGRNRSGERCSLQLPDPNVGHTPSGTP
jgi:RND family efflux transporter MFP subunit